jgi:hypothetical protein
MPESKRLVSHNILSQLEGERIRVILRDGGSSEGIVRRVDQRELRLSDQTILLDDIVTYFVLEKSERR